MRVSLLLLLAAGCSSGVDIRGGVGDPRYDFKALRTYAWMPLEPTGDPRIDEAALDARVKKGVEEELERKGYGLVAEGADFLVGYRAVLSSERSVQGSDEYEGIWTDEHTPRGAGNGGQVDKLDLDGMLVLRVFDGKSRNLVWEATAETELNPRASLLEPTREDKVRVAIRKMLERFPP